MLTPTISASPDLSSLDALALHALILADSQKTNSHPTPHLQSVGSMPAIKCNNRECSNMPGQLRKPRSIYCSRRCQSREQNLRQGRIRSASAADSSIIHHRKLSQGQHQTIDQDSELVNKVTQFQRFQSQTLLNNSPAELAAIPSNLIPTHGQIYISSNPGNILPDQFHSPFPFNTFVLQSHFLSPNYPSSYLTIYSSLSPACSPPTSNLPFVQLPVLNPLSHSSEPHFSTFSSPRKSFSLAPIPSPVYDALSISPLSLSHFDISSS